MSATVIIPYVFENEIGEVKDRLWNLPVVYERDDGRIGSDLMYQRMWNNLDTDVIIFHADMLPLPEDEYNQWYVDLCEYAEYYPEAGLLGCKLLYPAKNDDDNFWIECAGGKINDEGNPDHFGSGFDMFTQSFWKDNPEVDTGQYDHVREVAWTTFGGLYIKREVLDKVGDFSPEYEWTYNRDVDYCFKAREAGWKVYQTPVSILHFQSRDNKRISTPENQAAQQRNLLKLKERWENTEYYKTLNEKVN